MRAAPAADYNKNEIKYFVKLMIEDEFSSWLQQPARRFFCARWTDPGKKGVRKMKIIRQGKTAILLAAALFIGLFAIFPAQSLASESVTDRPSLDSENHNAYLVGYEDGTVRPQKASTRAEVATIFFRLLTEDLRIEESEIGKLDGNKICEYSGAYHTTNIKKLCSLLRRL